MINFNSSSFYVTVPKLILTGYRKLLDNTSFSLKKKLLVMQNLFVLGEQIEEAEDLGKKESLLSLLVALLAKLKEASKFVQTKRSK